MEDLFPTQLCTDIILRMEADGKPVSRLTAKMVQNVLWTAVYLGVVDHPEGTYILPPKTPPFSEGRP